MFKKNKKATKKEVPEPVKPQEIEELPEPTKEIATQPIPAPVEEVKPEPTPEEPVKEDLTEEQVKAFMDQSVALMKHQDNVIKYLAEKVAKIEHHLRLDFD